MQYLFAWYLLYGITVQCRYHTSEELSDTLLRSTEEAVLRP